MVEDRVQWDCPKCGKSWTIRRGQETRKDCPECRGKPTEEQIAEWERVGGKPVPRLNLAASEDRLYYTGLAYRILRMWFVIVFTPIGIGMLVFPPAGIAILLYIAAVYAYLKYCEACTRHF